MGGLSFRFSYGPLGRRLLQALISIAIKGICEEPCLVQNAKTSALQLRHRHRRRVGMVSFLLSSEPASTSDSAHLRINTRDGTPANPTDVSRGVFGATVGIDRLLKLWDKYNIKATWFTPAHSAESFPKQMRKIVEKGHEVGLHGYTHEFVSTLSEQQQRDVLDKSIQVLTDIVGKRPRGWTAPAWSTSKETIKLLEEFGIVSTSVFSATTSGFDSSPGIRPFVHVRRLQDTALD